MPRIYQTIIMSYKVFDTHLLNVLVVKCVASNKAAHKTHKYRCRLVRMCVKATTTSTNDVLYDCVDEWTSLGVNETLYRTIFLLYAFSFVVNLSCIFIALYLLALFDQWINLFVSFTDRTFLLHTKWNQSAPRLHFDAENQKKNSLEVQNIVRYLFFFQIHCLLFRPTLIKCLNKKIENNQQINKVSA